MFTNDLYFLNDQGIYPLTVQRKLPVHGDYTNAFVRPKSTESILTQKPLSLTPIHPSQRRNPSPSHYDGYNAYAVRDKKISEEEEEQRHVEMFLLSLLL